MTDYVHVSDSCKEANSCGQEDWSIRACNYLATLTDDDDKYIKVNDISLCAKTYIVDAEVNGQINFDDIGNNLPTASSGNFFIAEQSPSEPNNLKAWTWVKAFEASFNEIIMKLDDTYDNSHNHTNNVPVGDYDHTHIGDIPSNPVNFSTAGGMVTPHTHTSTTSGATTTYDPYPENGINRSNLVDTDATGTQINMFKNADDVTNWSFRDDHWKEIYITGDGTGATDISAEKWVTDLERTIQNIKDITDELRHKYNSSSISDCIGSGNLGKATHNEGCITDNNLSSKCLNDIGEYVPCSLLKQKERRDLSNNINIAHAAKLSAKNQTMLYNINVSATVNLAVGIAVLIYMIFKLFNLPNPAKKMGEVAGKISDGAKKTAAATKKNVGKAATVAKDGAAVAAKKTAAVAKKGIGKIDELTAATKAPIKK